MPPTSAVRSTQRGPDPTRRQSVRQARTSTTRPLNYYARPFGSFGGPVDELQDDTPPGFFPAIQYFTDSVTALPKEVMHHFTLIKEVEAKVYGPEKMAAQMAGRILDMPAPPRRSRQPSTQALLSFTANNSATNSHNGSVINGSAPGLQHQPSDADESSSQAPQIDAQADFARRQEFHNLRTVLSSMLVNLDEKNVVMAEANRVLARQLGRMESVIPHVENEISEEARLGSLTHWAYADNRVKKTSATANAEHRAARRDVAATNHLAAAAATVHEGDIAAARGEVRREVKKSRNQHVDSEFEDRPAKKPHPGKGRKVAEADNKGLGIMNGVTGSQPQKRRRVEKTGPVAMESTMSGTGKATKARGETPRSTPAAEPTKKKTKAAPLPLPIKKRYVGNSTGRKPKLMCLDNRNAINSPVPCPKIASPPTMGNFALLNEPHRPALARNRQGSSALQHTTLAEKSGSRPSSAAENKGMNGSNKNYRNSIAKSKEVAEDHRDRMDIDRRYTETRGDGTTAGQVKADDARAESVTGDAEPTVTRGRSSKVGTPTIGHAPNASIEMVRTRSNGVRSSDNVPTLAHKSSARNGEMVTRHSRSASGTHILKQIASFNRSPKLSRRELADNDEDDSEQGDEEEPEQEQQKEDERSRSRSPRRSVVPRASRRSQRARSPEEDEALAQEAEYSADGDQEADEDEVDVEDPDDPNEPKYCYCGRGSYGTMIACENPKCEKEWFHLECTGLRFVPNDNGELLDWSDAFALEADLYYREMVLS